MTDPVRKSVTLRCPWRKRASALASFCEGNRGQTLFSFFFLFSAVSCVPRAYLEFGISNFLELNLRTYVRDRSGNPGVWFYSLDANQSLAVAIARRFFHLPYIFAEMSAEHSCDGTIHYRSRRKGYRGDRHSGTRIKPFPRGIRSTVYEAREIQGRGFGAGRILPLCFQGGGPELCTGRVGKGDFC